MEVRLKKALKILSASVVSLIIILFSVPFLNNIHNAYIRILSRGVVMLTNSAGNSGSPAVNLYGSVVAVAFAANEAGSRSYFVPLSDLKNFLNEL